jgi:hypothetical protein
VEKQRGSAFLDLFYSSFSDAVGLGHPSRGGTVNQTDLLADLEEFGRVVGIEARNFVAPRKFKHSLHSVLGRLRSRWVGT